MMTILRGAALFHSRDIDELVEALTEEDVPPRGKVHPLPPRQRSVDGGNADPRAD